MLRDDYYFSKHRNVFFCAAHLSGKLIGARRYHQDMVNEEKLGTAY